MATERQPWYKEFPADWRGDANLRMCGLAARGLWHECRGLMHEAPQRGYLSLSIEQLALMVSRPLREVRAALAELEQHDVAHRDEGDRLFCPRMVQETARSQTQSENGRRGGNPAVSVKPSLNPDEDVSLGVSVKPASARPELLSSEDLGSGGFRSSPVRELTDRPPRGLADARFETFWTAYPCKKARKDAEKAFAKLKPDHELLAVLLDAVERHKTTRQWREGVYPHASTWLNGERWRDEITPESGPSRGSFGARSEGPPPPPPIEEVLRKNGLIA